MQKRIRKKSLSELDLSTIAQLRLTDKETVLLEKGIGLFNAGRFWEAHEAWEEIWQNHPEDGRFFIQGLIQLAAAFHQFHRQIYRGFTIHLERAEARLVLFPERFLGIDVKDLLAQIRLALREVGLQKRADSPEYSRICLPSIR